MIKALAAEALGAFFWVSAVCGAMLVTGEGQLSSAAIIATALGVGLIYGAASAALLPVSGAHFNPAHSVAALMSGEIKFARAVLYLLAQVLGGALAALALFLLLATTAGYMPVDFAANGYGSHSPGGFSAGAVFAAEMIFTGLFTLTVLALARRAEGRMWTAAFSGALLAGLYLIMMNIDNASLNPARSTATALFAEGWALSQLWMFWAGPMAGGFFGGIAARLLVRRDGAS